MEVRSVSFDHRKSLFRSASAGDEEVVLAPGAVDLLKAGALHGLELAVKVERPDVVAHDQVAAGRERLADATEEPDGDYRTFRRVARL